MLWHARAEISDRSTAGPRPVCQFKYWTGRAFTLHLPLYAMYAKTLSAIAVISAAAVAAQDPPKVNTPAFVAQCKPVKLTWQGGEPPYHLYVTAPGNIKEVKADLGDHKGTSMTWKVSIPEGEKFTLNLCDKSGQCQQSGQAGPVGSGDDSCLKGGDDKGSKSGGSGGAAAGGGGDSKSDDDSGKSKSDDSNKSKSAGGSSKSSDSKSSSSSSSSKSSGSPSSSSSGGNKSSSGSSSQPSSSSSGAAGGDGKDSEKNGDDKNSDSKDGEDDKGGNDGAATFSGVPAVVAGVVGIAIAALI